MLVQFGADRMDPEWPGSVVCIGTFDGVHLGHQALIGRAVGMARERDLPAIVLTFDRHPAETLAPAHAPAPLQNLGQNLAQIAKLGVSATVVLPFDKHLARCPAEQFYQTVLRNTLRAEAVAVGHDFAFGRGRQGTPEWLAERVETAVLPPVESAGIRVSSSRIREAVASGDCQLASSLLGRPFSLEGVVVRGKRLGRTLGYPTANLARPGRVAGLPFGIYAAVADTPFGRFKAAVSIGIRPTVDDSGVPSVEAFLLDYPGESLYGRVISLEFHQKLREEMRFDSVEDLCVQMGMDVELARQVLAGATADL
ncbi:MAG: bifunctional riboflavin kinase/FAD synthetase [Armatimonadetes bacterium]|nr:bifunctional riboflavin kinase/FAD synthetase [Armatimonadota bacterium]MBX3108176.1 bifunctional riboflavin kinase/FAD synthetase [Fimbriimonadaceae bacterium]